jgi:hypothetical protein
VTSRSSGEPTSSTGAPATVPHPSASVPVTTLRAPGVRTKAPVTSSSSSPEQIDLAIADLASRLGVTAEMVSVVDARPATWTDTSLGCPQPGVVAAAQIVNGSLLVLLVGGQTYEYHAGSSGDLFYCATPVAPLGPVD